MSHAWTHSWCKSLCRDEAVRASEDGRSGPLPTLEEAIAAVTERRPVDAGGGGNVTGLRTERVTLEVTHDLDAPLGEWIAQVIDESLGYDEHVLVVEETHFDDLAQVALQRDAAIRERDAAKSHAEKSAVRIKSQAENVDYYRRDRDETFSELAAALREREEFRRSFHRSEEAGARLLAERDASRDDADGLRARVAELESQLESVACRAATAETALEAAAKLAPTANADGGSNHATPAASGAAGTEPVAWAILRGGHFIVATVNEAAANESCKDYGGTVVPLYAAPQPATGWLTAEERGSIWYAIEGLREAASRRNNGHARTLESLLDRSSPPEVVRPPYKAGHSMRDGEWIEALAAAGVKVKEVG